MKACPNINSKEWKFLEEKLGEKEAYRVFISNGYQLPNYNDAKGIVADRVISKFLNSIGIKTEAYDRVLSKNGESVDAVAKLADRVIEYVEGKTPGELLPEEAGHFILELIKDDALRNRLLDIVSKEDMYKEILGEAYEEYKKKYNNDTDLLLREAAGKLLGKYLKEAAVGDLNYQNGTILQSKTLKKILDAIIRSFKTLFNKHQSLVEKYKTDIDAAYVKVAEVITKNDPDLLDVDKDLSKSHEMYKTINLKLGKYQEVVFKIFKQIEANKKYYRATKNLKGLDREEKIEQFLAEIAEVEDEANYKQAVINYLEVLNNELDNINNQVAELRKSGDKMSVKDAARAIVDMRNYVAGHKAISENIKAALENDTNPDAKDLNNKLIELIDDFNKATNNVNNIYKSMSKSILKGVFTPFLTKNPNLNIDSIISGAEKSLGWMTRLFRAMGNAPNEFLNIIDQIVKFQKDQARQDTREFAVEILKLQKQLEKAGIKDTEWMFQRDSKGNLTAYFIDDINYSLYNIKVQEAYKAYSKERKLNPEEAAENLAKFFEDNTIPRPDAGKLVLKMKKELDAESFKVWKERNTRQNEDGTVSYIRDLAMPDPKKYGNGDFKKNWKPEQIEYYNFVMKHKNRLDIQINKENDFATLAPQVRKNLVDRLKKSYKDRNPKAGYEQLKGSLADAFIVTEDDTEFGRLDKIQDAAGNVMNVVPTYFTTKVSDPETNLSTDVTSTMIMYANMANDFKHMNEIVNIMEISKDVVNDMDIKETKRGRTVFEKVKIGSSQIASEKSEKAGKDSHIYKTLSNYIDSRVYGQRTVTANMNIGKVSGSKILDFILKYASLKYLGLNVFAGAANVFMGKIMTRLEAASGLNFNHTELAKAEQTYIQEITGIGAEGNGLLHDMGQRLSNNKLRLFLEHFDILSDFENYIRDPKANRHSVFGQLFNTSAAYAISSSGEHYLQSITALAMAQRVNFTGPDGKTYNLYEAMEVKDHKLVLKEGMTRVESEGSWGKRSEFGFGEMVRKVNQDLHGIYNDSDRNEAQRHILGKLFMMFRKFMVTGIDLRYGRKRYDYRLNREVQGYYRQVFGDIKEYRFKYITEWKNLDPAQRAAGRRMLLEMTYLAALGSILAFGIGDEDDDDWKTAMLTYQLKRVRTELMAFYWPPEVLRIVQDPIAATNAIEDTFSLITSLITLDTDEIERGRYKGLNRIQRDLRKAIPLYKNIADLSVPEEKLRFFN